MNARICLPMVLLLSISAKAQSEQFFGDGKPFEMVEQDVDRRFVRTRIGLALRNGSFDSNCIPLLGGLLTALAEAGPLLHQRDDKFILHPALLQAVQTQLSHSRFPASTFLAAMVRRVLVEKKLPDEWMAVAEQLNPQLGIIDMGKLRMLQEGFTPIESFYLTLPALKDRHELEVVRANSASSVDSRAEFRDGYLDRDIAWGELNLVDISYPKSKSGQKKVRQGTLQAVLAYQPPSPNTGSNPLILLTQRKPPPLKVVATLATVQFVDLTKLPRGKRLLVRGKLWDVNAKGTEFSIRNAQLFEDRDWSQGAFLATPESVQSCTLAINDLTGIAPAQPGGFGHH